MVESFFEGFVLVVDCDFGDLVDLVKTLDAVLDELAKFDCGFNCVGDALDDDDAGLVLAFVEKFDGALEVSADANLSLDADLVCGESLLRLLDSSVLVSHVKEINK